MNHSVLHAVMFETPLLACEVIIFGLAIFCAIVNAAGATADLVSRRVLAALRFIALAAILWALVDLIHQAAEMAAVPMADAVRIVPEMLTGTHVGRIWIARLSALAALNAFAWMRPRANGAGLAALAAVLLLLRALASHAIDDGAVAAALYFVHEMCAAIWFGSLIGILAGYRVAGGADADGWFVAAAPRVSRAAGVSLAVLAATGVYAAYDGIGLHPGNLIYSAYGRALILKLAIAAVAVAIGGYNRTRLIPALDSAASRAALRGNVAAEVVILAVVLACSAALAATPPVH
jgi:putative copper export protein